MNTPHAFTQFCDDVRHEADGRASLMGVYPGSAEVELQAQGKLIKICAYSVITIPYGLSLVSLSVASLWGGQELSKVELPIDEIDALNQQQKQAGQGKQNLVITTVNEIRDLDIGEGGTLYTFVTLNGQVIARRGLGLMPRPVP